MKRLTCTLLALLLLLSSLTGLVACGDGTGSTGGEKESFTVTFNSDGGTAVDPQTVEDGGRATEPTPAPTKEGYTFLGWYNGENAFNFKTTPITASITLTAKWKEGDAIVLKYDDRYDLSGKTVEVIDAGIPTSFQVGFGVPEYTLDAAVITIEDDTLIATGTGSAFLKIDGLLHEVIVSPAPISLILLIGQSNMQGSEGNEDQSIICPDGMVYSTYGDRYNMTVSNATNYAPSALTGAGSLLNVNGSTEKLEEWPVYLLNEKGVGKKGPDSGFAYEWVQQTGEKIWVVNAAHGGSAISSWQSSGDNYKEAIALFSACQETLKQEIAAGHYTLSHMGYFWCQGCADASMTAEQYVNKYLTMHENLKSTLAFDHDDDRSTDLIVFEFAGIIPILYGAESYRAGTYQDKNNYTYYESFELLRFNGPRVAQYWMTSNPDLPDIWNVCNIGENWVWMPDNTNGVSDYFNAHYENGRVDYQTQVEQDEAWYTPTTPKDVHDSIHYNQIGYNEVGREATRNALILLGDIPEPDVEVTVEFLAWDGYTRLTEINPSTTGKSSTLVVPYVSPVWKSKEVSYTLEGELTWVYCDLLASSAQASGTLRASVGDAIVTVSSRELAAYRWDLQNNLLVSTGATTNTITKVKGSMKDGMMIDTQYKLDEAIMLLHDQNWVLEWKMSGVWYDSASTASKKIFCEEGSGTAAGGMCLLVSGKNDRISLGYYSGSTHISYGLELDDYGISVADSHVYRLENRVKADGTNMIYLSVDGREIGAMLTYFTGSAGNTGTTSDWLSGQDFTFKYMGTTKYLLDNGLIEYVSVVESSALAQ